MERNDAQPRLPFSSFLTRCLTKESPVTISIPAIRKYRRPPISSAAWLRMRPCRISVSHKLSRGGTAVSSSRERSLEHVTEGVVKSKLGLVSVPEWNLKKFVLVYLRVLQLKLWLLQLQVRPQNVYHRSTYLFFFHFSRTHHINHDHQQNPPLIWRSRSKYGATGYRIWLRHWTISWKVAGSIPDGVIGILHWHPSGLNMALGSTQALTKISTRDISWGKGGRCIGLTTLPPSCADCLEIWEPQPPGTLRECP
jgi:hypothetical protein